MTVNIPTKINVVNARMLYTASVKLAIMSDEDEEICRFGTPLDPIKEDEVPSKKPITIADQIAVDVNGRRRFHGAFTGGFSAGFWNTVGSKEGWTPQAFKSSRGEKATHSVQKPNDFMDDEDVGEFGIAPQRIQTRDDFTPNETEEQISSKNKRKLPTNSSGPIPGVPVLHLVLESCRDKVAVRLLKRMEPKLAGKILNKVEKPPKVVESEVKEDESPEADGDASAKVYQCDMGPFQHRRSVDDDSGSDSDSVGLDDLMFADDDFDEYAKHVKNDRFGLEYVGLDKGAFFGTSSSDAAHQKSLNLFSSFEMVDKNNKKLSIKGQAFGVGAFEEDDDDIYAKDDMTKYDFLLGGKANVSSRPKKAIENKTNFIEGFVEGEANVSTKKVFRVNVPRSFEPRNWQKRRSRFGPETTILNETEQKQRIGRHDMKPSQRGQILNEKSRNDGSTGQKVANIDADSMLQAVGLKSMSFVTETPKGDGNATEQQRSISPSLAENVDDLITKMDASIRTISTERKKFEPPALVPFISDRFVTAGASTTTDAVKTIEIPRKPSEMEKLPEIKIVRTKSTWLPCQLLCYKMNIEAAVGTKPDTKTKSFSLFSCLTAANEANGKKPLQFTNTGSFLQDAENEVAKQSQKEREMQFKQSTEANRNVNVPKVSESPAPSTSIAAESSALNPPKTSVPVKRESVKKTELELKIIDAQDKHPAQKKDIYKAIFDSSDDDSDADAEPAVNTGDANGNVTGDSTSMDVKHTQPAPNYQTLPDIAFMPKSAKEINILRNTSPPRGIFSGLLMKRPTEQVKPVQEAVQDSPIELPPDSYGPRLPTTFQRTSIAETSTSAVPSAQSRGSIASISTASGNVYQVHVEEQWIEKSASPESKHKKEKKAKKKSKKESKKERKKDKHKSSHHREKKKKSKR